jgi:hypothetical protein
VISGTSEAPGTGRLRRWRTARRVVVTDGSAMSEVGGPAARKVKGKPVGPGLPWLAAPVRRVDRRGV